MFERSRSIPKKLEWELRVTSLVESPATPACKARTRRQSSYPIHGRGDRWENSIVSYQTRRYTEMMSCRTAHTRDGDMGYDVGDQNIVLPS
jgi:hypothetical protein